MKLQLLGLACHSVLPVSSGGFLSMGERLIICSLADEEESLEERDLKPTSRTLLLQESGEGWFQEAQG